MAWPQPPSSPGPYPSSAGPPLRRGVSGWAIAALVLGLLACVPLGAIFGIVGIVKTKGGEQSGLGLAIAGLVLSMVWTPVWVIAAVAVIANNQPFITGTVDSSPVFRVGECFMTSNLDAVDCSKPHSNEVFAVLELSRFSTDDGDQQLKDRCTAELQKYSPSAIRDPHVQIQTWGPDSSWKYMNNHTAACVAYFTAPRVGSIRG